MATTITQRLGLTGQQFPYTFLVFVIALLSFQMIAPGVAWLLSLVGISFGGFWAGPTFQVLLIGITVYLPFRFVISANPFESKSIFTFLILMVLFIGLAFFLPKIATPLFEASTMQMRASVMSIIPFG